MNPLDARSRHLMAHVFETSERVEAGVRWMNEPAGGWSTGSVVATHC